MTKALDSITAWLLSYESGKMWYNKLVSEATKKAGQCPMCKGSLR